MADANMHFREKLAQRRAQREGRTISAPLAQPNASQTAPSLGEILAPKPAEREEKAIITPPKQPTPSNTFPLFPRLPAELQALIYSHAAFRDRLAPRETMNITPFLSSKLDDFTA